MKCLGVAEKGPNETETCMELFAVFDEIFKRCWNMYGVDFVFMKCLSVAEERSNETEACMELFVVLEEMIT